jgi:hypothetical protein
VLARTLVKARRAIPILPCEPHFAPVIEYIDLDRYHMGVAVYERAIPEFLGTA